MVRFEKYNWSNRLVLIVDDDRASALLLEVILSKTGAKVIYANNGSKAIEIFLSTKGIDLILMDLRMEGLNGLEVTRIIRKYDKNVPIIAQTACAIKGDRENCLSFGCNDYISKPIIAEDLMELLNKYLEVHADSGMLCEQFPGN